MGRRPGGHPVPGGQVREHVANGAVDAATWTMLEQQPSSATDAAQHGRGPEYDRMLEDGLLDVTLAIGFDEHAGPSLTSL